MQQCLCWLAPFSCSSRIGPADTSHWNWTAIAAVAAAAAAAGTVTLAYFTWRSTAATACLAATDAERISLEFAPHLIFATRTTFDDNILGPAGETIEIQLRNVGRGAALNVGVCAVASDMTATEEHILRPIGSGDSLTLDRTGLQALFGSQGREFVTNVRWAYCTDIFGAGHLFDKETGVEIEATARGEGVPEEWSRGQMRGAWTT